MCAYVRACWLQAGAAGGNQISLFPGASGSTAGAFERLLILGLRSRRTSVAAAAAASPAATAARMFCKQTQRERERWGGGDVSGPPGLQRGRVAIKRRFDPDSLKTGAQTGGV